MTSHSNPSVPAKTSLQPPGRTGDVFTSLLARLSTVETQLRASKIQVQLKEAEIENLQTELDFQKELAAKKGDEEKLKALEELCNEYKTQIADMQIFLKDHGMLWKQGYDIKRFTGERLSYDQFPTEDFRRHIPIQFFAPPRLDSGAQHSPWTRTIDRC